MLIHICISEEASKFVLGYLQTDVNADANSKYARLGFISSYQFNKTCVMLFLKLSQHKSKQNTHLEYLPQIGTQSKYFIYQFD